jgi:DNA invertase Pin-like site-specific DNA recombinase
MGTSAGIYARISHDPSGTMLGVTRQVADCRSLAERLGLRIVEEYVDDDRSAWSGKARPAYQRMLADIAGGSLDAVLVWHADRLHRQPRELEDFIKVCEPRGIATHACISGLVDLSNPDGRLVARMLGAVAAHESDSRSRRIRRKHQELAESGKPVRSGTRPFGYAADFVTLDHAEADAIRAAARRVLAGDSLRGIATDWNVAGLRTTPGKPWTIQTLGRMLQSGRIAGMREYKGEIVAKATWPAIVTQAEHDRIVGLLTSRTRHTTRTPRRYLLTGLLRCGRCGHPLGARPRSDGTRRYLCLAGPGRPGCGKLAVLADPIEALIAEAVLIRLDTPELAAALAGAAIPDDTGQQADLVRDREQLDELARAYGERQITFSEYLAARKPIEARIEAAQRYIAGITKTEAITRHVGRGSALRETWADLALTRQRAIVEAVLDRAVVAPAVRGRARFDPDRVEPVWRV